MTNKIDWFFRERDPGEAFRGGVDNFAFQMSIDTLVRETIQNSNDQRVGKKVIVEFIFEDHQGNSADKLLDLIGWKRGLEDSLKSISLEENHLSRRATRVLKAAKDRNFASLTIRDLNARGLEGEEDGDNGNFVMLCRHVLVTDAARKALRGGSFGIGKSVLWAFSGASVAIFSSLPLEWDRKTGKELVGAPRLFGRAYLVSHKRGQKWFNSDGHLGTRSVSNGKEWAVSVRGDEVKKLLNGSALSRDWKETGTSILIPFLDNPREEEVLTAESVIEKITSAVQKWFWPSIDSGILEVRVGTRKDGKEKLSTVGLPKWVNHFKNALTATSYEKITEENGNARCEIDIKIPEREIDPKHSKIQGESTLYLSRLNEQQLAEIPSELIGTVALIRGAQMVVQYHAKSFSPLMPPFVGVLKAGSFRSQSKEDSAVEAFLRDSEPPAHDKWEPASEKIGDNYKIGGQKALREFFEGMRDAARNLLGSNSSGSGKVPRKLAELLRGGKGREKKPRLERFEMSGKTIDRSDPNEIKASFTIHRNAGTGSWCSTVSIVLLDEQGTPRELHVREINRKDLEKSGIKCDAVPGKVAGTVRSYKLSIPGSINELEVHAIATVAASKVAHRSMADVKVSYSQSERTTK
jgi:hypothetical protein